MTPSLYLRTAAAAAITGWNKFWFTPRDPATLGVLRSMAGLMLLYTHAVWTCDWQGFFGLTGWLDSAAREARFQLPAGQPRPFELYFVWSHFDWIDSPVVLWVMHWIALGTFALLTLGLFTRYAAIAAWLFTISYSQRAPLAQFGLDGINSMLAMYLMIGPAAACFSLDARRRGGGNSLQPSIGANIAIRLIQCHMCLIYLFSALGKLQGETWWNGSAMWLAVANLEYQSWDLTWSAVSPWLGCLLTHLTVAWELSYPVLIWPRLWRPLMLAMAVAVHLGIGWGMGMMTFGLVMLIGNFAFVESTTVRGLLAKTASTRGNTVPSSNVTPSPLSGRKRRK